MKKLLTFLLVFILLAGAVLGVCRYMETAGHFAALGEGLRSYVHALIQQTPDSDGGEDAPTGQDPPTPGQENPADPPTKGPGYDEDGRLTDPDEALHALLYDAATAFGEEVDIGHLGYTPEALDAEISQFFFLHPELFYVDNGYSYATSANNIVQKLRLRYLTAPEQAALQLAFYENTLDGVVAGIPAGATDFDKVLYLHDYLVQNYAYDHEGLAAEQATGQSLAVRDAYGFFSRKVGVCQAYMLAMIALCERAGIPALPVTSDEMAHAWNLVKLDGEWYHVDVTFDDPGGEEGAVYPSYVSYNYFLLSGEALYQSGRTARWLTSERANCDKYDAAPWRQATTPIATCGGEYLCAVYDRMQGATRILRGSATQMHAAAELDARWYSAPFTFYQGAWASIAVYEERVLVSTAKEFFFYDMSTNTLTLASDLAYALGNKQIFGVCEVKADGTVYFVVAADYKGTFEIRSWQIPVNGQHL